MSSQQKKDLGNIAYKEKNYDKALACYTEAIEIDPHVAMYYSNRAAAYFMMGKFKNSLVDCKKAIELDLHMIKCYVRGAKCHLKRGEFNLALELLNQCLEPTDSTVLAETALIKRFQTKYNDAIADVMDASKLEDLTSNISKLKSLFDELTDFFLVKCYYIEALAIGSKFTEIENLVKDFTRTQPDSGLNHYAVGILHYFRFHHDDTIKELELCQSFNLPPEAIARAREYILKVKKQYELHRLGMDGLENSMFDEAEVLFSNASAVDVFASEFNASAHLYRAKIYYAKDDIIESIDACIDALECKKTAQIYFQLAQGHFKMEEWEDVVRECDNAKQAGSLTLSLRENIDSLSSKARHKIKEESQLDFYSLLELPKNATFDEIKKAYRTKALIHHPDKNVGSCTTEKRAEMKFKQISVAYEVLSDPSKRKRYDAGDYEPSHEHHHHNHTSDDEGEHDYRSFFEMFMRSHGFRAYSDDDDDEEYRPRRSRAQKRAEKRMKKKRGGRPGMFYCHNCRCYHHDDDESSSESEFSEVSESYVHPTYVREMTEEEKKKDAKHKAKLEKAKLKLQAKKDAEEKEKNERLAEIEAKQNAIREAEKAKYEAERIAKIEAQKAAKEAALKEAENKKKIELEKEKQRIATKLREKELEAERAQEALKRKQEKKAQENAEKERKRLMREEAAKLEAQELAAKREKEESIRKEKEKIELAERNDKLQKEKALQEQLRLDRIERERLDKLEKDKKKEEKKRKDLELENALKERQRELAKAALEREKEKERLAREIEEKERIENERMVAEYLEKEKKLREKTEKLKEKPAPVVAPTPVTVSAPVATSSFQFVSSIPVSPSPMEINSGKMKERKDPNIPLPIEIQPENIVAPMITQNSVLPFQMFNPMKSINPNYISKEAELLEKQQADLLMQLEANLERKKQLEAMAISVNLQNNVNMTLPSMNMLPPVNLSSFLDPINLYQLAMGANKMSTSMEPPVGLNFYPNVLTNPMLPMGLNPAATYNGFQSVPATMPISPAVVAPISAPSARAIDFDNMNLQAEDCSAYFDTTNRRPTCENGTSCEFRHCFAARGKGKLDVCSNWSTYGGCLNCTDRHRLYGVGKKTLNITPNPIVLGGSASSVIPGVAAQKKSNGISWACSKCSYINAGNVFDECEMCGAEKLGSKESVVKKESKGKKCPFFPNCKFGSKCNDFHPVIPCKFKEACRNSRCNYHHMD